MKPASPTTIRHAVAENRSVRASVIALLVSNAIPLLGVLLLRWDIFTIMFLFWFENVIIGVFNVLKMTTSAGSVTVQASKFFVVPFFCVHYGLFTLVHGIFVFVLFGGLAGPQQHMNPEEIVHFAMPAVLGRMFVPALAIFLSHALSFYVNWIKQEEFRKFSPQELMGAPYGRIVVLHIVIILGGMAAMAVGAPWPAVALLVALKIGIDLAAHVAERKRAEARPATLL